MSKANDFLEKIREKIGPVPRSLGWFKLSPITFPEPSWVEEASEDDEPIKEIFPGLNRLWTHGAVVWGHLVRANANLFEPGEDDYPGTFIFSPTATDDEAEKLLPDFAARLGRMRESDAPDPKWIGREREWFEDLKNDTSYHRGYGLPTEWQTGAQDYAGSTLVLHRKHLPTGVLTTRMLPLLVDPVSSIAQVIPVQYWPDSMTAWLEQEHGGVITSPEPEESETFLAENPTDPEERKNAYAAVFGPIVSVNHDLVSSPPLIEVYRFEWGPPRNECAYLTGGMSDAIQPAGGDFGRIEFVFYTKEHHDRYPRMLHAFARYPWESGASISPGDCVPLDDFASAMLDTDRFTALLFLSGVAQPEVAIAEAPCLVASNTKFLTVIPLTEAELEFKLAHGLPAFLDLIRENGFELAFSPDRAELVG